MRLAVLVPFRPSNDLWRRPARNYVEQHLRDTFPNDPLFIVDDGFDPFSRGASITTWALPLHADVFLVCDADLIVPAGQLREVVRLAGESPGLVIPFDRYLYLTPNQSKKITTPGFKHLPNRPRHSWTMQGSVGGAGAFNRATLDITGGYPPIFRSWGFEDEAFALLCDELAGPTRRVAGDALHLFHPVDPTNDENSPGYQRNLHALQQLIAARGRGPDALRRALGQRTEA